MTDCKISDLPECNNKEKILELNTPKQRKSTVSLDYIIDKLSSINTDQKKGTYVISEEGEFLLCLANEIKEIREDINKIVLDA